MKRFLLIVAFVALPHAGVQAAGEHGAHGAGSAAQGMQHGGHGAISAQHGGHAPAAGQPGNPTDAKRTIDIVMTEFRYDPARLEAKSGETVRFRVRNTGQVQHELVLGDAAELKAHAKMMSQPGGMAHKEANALTLDPDKSGELVWKFGDPGTFEYACLLPGHYEAGMRGQVVVRK